MHENNINRAVRHRPTVIEVAGEPQGVVVPEANGYKFMAVKLPAFPIDGQHFPTIELAHRAVREVVEAPAQ